MKHAPEPDDARARQRLFLDATMPHLDVLFAIARNFARDPNRAEDLVQETFLRAYSAFETHDGKHTKAWLATICVNLARDHSRRRAVRVVEEPMPASLDFADETRGVADEAIAQLERGAVARALAQLPSEQREAIVLMDIAGQSAQEAADAVGCPRNTILSRVHRGRRRLALLLDPEEVDRGLS